MEDHFPYETFKAIVEGNARNEVERLQQRLRDTNEANERLIELARSNAALFDLAHATVFWLMVVLALLDGGVILAVGIGTASIIVSGAGFATMVVFLWMQFLEARFVSARRRISAGIQVSP